MQEESIESIEKKIGNLYAFMDLQETANVKEIKKSYKLFALAYHPDKNPDNPDKFLQLKICYDVLTNRRQEYDNYLFAKKQSVLRYQQYDNLAKNLIEREKEAESQKQEQKKNYAEEMLKKRRQREEENEREQQLLEKQRQMDEKIIKNQFKQIYLFRDNTELYKKLNSIQVSWTSEASYDNDLLCMLFESYGTIKEIQIISEQQGMVLIQPIYSLCKLFLPIRLFRTIRTNKIQRLYIQKINKKERNIWRNQVSKNNNRNQIYLYRLKILIKYLQLQIKILNIIWSS